jgi:general secretion pathway protein K
VTRGPIPPARERGVILINVLLFVAIASAVVLLMITAEEGALHRSARFADAAHARAAALGGELSAIVALRRDALVAPDSFYATEPWAQVAQHDTAIRGGRVDLAIADAEDRFNSNLLMKDDPASLALGRRIGAVLGLSPALLQATIDYVRVAGPISNLGRLRAASLQPDTLARLTSLVTALPEESGINLNSVGPDLLGVMIGDPAAATRLVALRAKQGFLTPENLLVEHVSQPPLSRFRSSLFWVRVRVRIGDADQQLTSLVRRRNDGKKIEVVAIERWWGDPPPQSSIQR